MSDFKNEFDELEELSGISNNTPINKKPERKEAFVSSSEEEEIESLEALVKSEPVKAKPLFDEKQVEGLDKELREKTAKAVARAKERATALNEASQGFKEGVALYFDTWKKAFSVFTSNAFKKKAKEEPETRWDDLTPSDPVKVPQKGNWTDSYGDVPLTVPTMEVIEEPVAKEPSVERQGGGFPSHTKKMGKTGWVALAVILLSVLFAVWSKLPPSPVEPVATVQETEAVADDMNREEVATPEPVKQEPAVPTVDTVKQPEVERPNPQLKNESVAVEEPKATTPPVRQEKKKAVVIKNTAIQIEPTEGTTAEEVELEAWFKKLEEKNQKEGE